MSHAPLDPTEVATARLRWTSATLLEWYPEEVLRRRLAATAAGDLALVGDRGFAAEFRRQINLPVDADELHWANRMLPLADGAWALAGIRYRGLDVRRPFVDVLACSSRPTATAALTVAQQIAAEYAPFRPRCVRFDVPDPDGLVVAAREDAGFGSHTGIDQYVVAGLVDALRTQPSTPAGSRIELRAADPGELAGRAAAIYEALARSASESTMWATPEDEASLAACTEEGLLFEVLADGASAGVVAAAREDAHALSGFVVRELCLDADHRGLGLGPAVLRRLVSKLPAGPRDTLWGTIHPDNIASLRNALRIGRQKVGGFVWVTPPGLPGMTAAP